VGGAARIVLVVGPERAIILRARAAVGLSGDPVREVVEMNSVGDVTALLATVGKGGREALDRLLPIVYEELQRMARRQLRTERSDHTLATSDLVHEAYLRLGRLDRMEWKGRAQFFAVAAQAMRRVLVDHALARRTAKRGGGLRKVPLEEGMLVAEEEADELLALEGALARLEQIDERLVRIVECRYFGGMSIEETADALEVSPATVKRDWAVARAWLNRELLA
jgi:RNA polymerase sigma-70 factor, ECF subfamily